MVASGPRGAPPQALVVRQSAGNVHYPPVADPPENCGTGKPRVIGARWPTSWVVAPLSGRASVVFLERFERLLLALARPGPLTWGLEQTFGTCGDVGRLGSDQGWSGTQGAYDLGH